PCIRFCQIIYLYDSFHSKNSPNSRVPTAHVRWYDHGSKTILQEMAHPYALFALTECNDIDVGAIMGPCTVQHLKPGDEEPLEYHCGYMWDASALRFKGISTILCDSPSGERECMACDLKEEQDRIADDEVSHLSKGHLTLRGIDYHKHDFVYIAEKENHPYLIGQIQQFIFGKELKKPSDPQVKVRILGRFDDVIRQLESNMGCNEKRLYLTDMIKLFSLTLIEGKCFVQEKGIVQDNDISDHFYVDRQSKELHIQQIGDLRHLHETLETCDKCPTAKQQHRTLYSFHKANSKLKAMELFAGAGGLSTGLEQSGFIKSHWAVELCPRAAATFQANHPDAIVYNADTNECLRTIIESNEHKPPKPVKTVNHGKYCMPPKGEVDLISGGFPCQSFSGLNHQRHNGKDDPRTPLVANMLSYVEYYRPRFVLMENVKGLLQHHTASSDEDGDEKTIKMSVVKFILRALLRLGYQAEVKILQAGDYGSPQRRERVIFWGALRSEILPEYPLPTHVNTRKKTQTLKMPYLDNLIPARRSERSCAPFRALVIADAISDLPEFDWKCPSLYNKLSTEAKKQRKDEREYPEMSATNANGRTLVGYLNPIEYSSKPLTSYQRRMRGDQKRVTLHCSRAFSEVVVERVWHISGPKVNGPEDIPEHLLPPRLSKAKESEKTRIWRDHFGRLKWDEPFNTALTICRPFSKGGKCIHPTQRRIITARECARSQGFPDSYEFKMSKDDTTSRDWGKLVESIHRQIGNAVPVPLAYALGKSLGEALIKKWKQDTVVDEDDLDFD
ncbi:hypothetical protein M422DRAFT_37561, partial [Sphaerobolus stellatus SS14]